MSKQLYERKHSYENEFRLQVRFHANQTFSPGQVLEQRREVTMERHIHGLYKIHLMLDLAYEAEIYPVL